MNISAKITRSLDLIISVQDLLIGGGFLIFIVFFHTIGVKFISSFFQKRADKISVKPKFFAPDLLFAISVSYLFLIHFLEVILWTALIVNLGLVLNWRSAAFFAANAYTTVGYGADILPPKWQMLAPIIAMSGLFTFGWTGSVLVGFVLRYNKLRDQRR